MDQTKKIKHNPNYISTAFWSKFKAEQTIIDEYLCEKLFEPARKNTRLFSNIDEMEAILRIKKDIINEINHKGLNNHVSDEFGIRKRKRNHGRPLVSEKPNATVQFFSTENLKIQVESSIENETSLYYQLCACDSCYENFKKINKYG